ncbi:unnamed protein product [Paramecium primaurelia]|uniref:Uncharacterized protein n=1 Tax=Paramecium primaurelia TaxID=5886 RepID=A0A8S1MTE8_PARPR|nr:unnamed protein product [Paramecium primaurelia]
MTNYQHQLQQKQLNLKQQFRVPHNHQHQQNLQHI